MTAIRVLVVDDSVVIRKLLTTTLEQDPTVKVAATAAHGKIALAKIPQVNPDVVILDIDMPELDGLETLTLLRKEWPKLPVIMFSTKTERGSASTLEALMRGASDYVCKPSNVGSMALAMARVRDEMVPKIKALATRSAALPHRPDAPLSAAIVSSARPDPSPGSNTAPRQHFSPAPAAKAPGTALPFTSELPVALVAIGASTGGPNALSRMLSQLPSDFAVPIVIVQHMLPTFTQHFATRLAAECRLTVVEARAGDILRPGTVYVARGDYHMLVERRGTQGVIAMNQGTPENFCRPAVDVLFASVATSYGPAALSVVLTGMGQDGLRGATAIRSAGGNVIVQDEATSVVWGMPRFVAEAGLASQVLPIDRMAAEVERLVSRRGTMALARGATR